MALKNPEKLTLLTIPDLKMKKNYSPTAALSAALISTLLTGCIKDGNTTGSPTRGIAVKFSTSISKTRAHGNVWEPGDQIGVWMLPAGTTDWSNPETAPLGSNMLYGHGSGTESAKVVFSGIGEENILVWPDEGSVDFVAYYPYLAEGIEGSVYPVDIADQEPQKAIDLMYSDNAAGLDVSSGNPALSFGHMLAKLVFNVEDAGGASLEDMTATFEGLPATASFDLATGGMVEGGEGEPTKFDAVLTSTFDADENDVDETAVVEAIVLPGTGLDYTLTFVLANGEKAVFTPNDALVTYQAGKRYIYNISFKRDPVGVVFEDADGELKSIVDWTDVEDEYPYELPKDKDPEEGGPFTGEKGETYNSGALVTDSEDYSVALEGSGTGFKLGADGRLTILVEDYKGGVASVSVNISTSYGSSGVISSVRANGTPFTCDDNGTPLTSMPVIDVEAGHDFVFTAPEGKLFPGPIEIVVERTSGSITVDSFKVN